MTLSELWILVKHHCIFVGAVIIAGALIACGVYFTSGIPNSYQARALITVNSKIESVDGLVSSYISESHPTSGITFSSKSTPSTMTITLTATGMDANACVDAVNEAAHAIKKSAETFISDFQDPFKCEIREATNAVSQGSFSHMMKYCCMGALAGLFISICLLLLLDFKRQRIKTAKTAQEVCELPVLAAFPVDQGEKLLANVRFAAEREGIQGDAFTVLVVPALHEDVAQIVTNRLVSVIKNESSDIVVSCTKSLEESMKTAYEARKAHLVIVAVAQWQDSIPQLVSTVDELRFAEASLGGLVFVAAK